MFGAADLRYELQNVTVRCEFLFIYYLDSATPNIQARKDLENAS